MFRIRRCTVIAVLVALLSYASAVAQPVAPELNSRPGAAFTLYLNFTGFQYTGNWGGQTPGTTPAYNNQTGSSFTAVEQAAIKNIWARVAETFTMFNINVTTVDPAAAAGHTSYLARQHYYDTTARVHHTIIGDGASNFFGGAAGVSYVGVWDSSNAAGSGRGTNWTFTNRSGGYGSFKRISSVTVHENGHAAGLSHQGDYVGSTRVNEYSTNNGSTHTRPVTGTGNAQNRIAWAVGRVNTNTSVIQNDALRILQNDGMGPFINDGIGRTMVSATELVTNGNEIDSLANQGIIVPISNTNPNPIGVDNYTRGYFSFTTVTGGINTITVNAGTQWITTGVPDPHQSLDATLRILDMFGNQLAVSATANFSETISLHLDPGSYFIEVSSAGGKFASLGPNNNWDPKYFYDMGSYFLTGTILAVPEPSSAILLTSVFVVLVLGRSRVQGRGRYGNRR
ncbi:MAG TPA: T9SS type A sorting domain-containing protein [Pirellulaceae bacterium]|nr:T9SS type A sorting domain-containing protein [Pirellulaceae bacterium]HMO93538.1 T9SS type A sorting domain-containing protein [Pirellulaceae bacterium]HMP70350.1 T9SS type A sorting domain-containing protein [Pirellulaceae bacterium]